MMLTTGSERKALLLIESLACLNVNYLLALFYNPVFGIIIIIWATLLFERYTLPLSKCGISISYFDLEGGQPKLLAFGSRRDDFRVLDDVLNLIGQTQCISALRLVMQYIEWYDYNLQLFVVSGYDENI